MKKIFLLGTIFLFGCQSQNTPTGAVPESWYRLPEEGQASAEEFLEPLAHNFQTLLLAQKNALEHIPKLEPQSEPESRPANWVPWHLAAFRTNLAVGIHGAIGALLSEGTAAVRALWLRQTDPTTHAAGHLLKKQRSDLPIEGLQSFHALPKLLEPVIQSALAQGKIRNETEFRKNLIKEAEKFNALASKLQELHTVGNAFRVSGFHLELAFGADGQLVNGPGLGAELGLRFDWKYKKVSSAQKFMASVSFPETNRLAENLESFVRSVLPDIEAALGSTKSLEKNGFSLSEIHVGLGIGAEKSIHLVSASVDQTAVLEFEKDQCSDPDGDGDCHDKKMLMLAESRQDFPDLSLLERDPRPNKLSYAALENVPVEAKPIGVIYRIKHKSFQRGLEKAISMGSFFAKAASSIKSTEWKLAELETEFDLSITGNLGLALVGGHGEIELGFAKLGETDAI